jgi:hypothetical protein
MWCNSILTDSHTVHTHPRETGDYNTCFLLTRNFLLPILGDAGDDLVLNRINGVAPTRVNISSFGNSLSCLSPLLPPSRSGSVCPFFFFFFFFFFFYLKVAAA